MCRLPAEGRDRVARQRHWFATDPRLVRGGQQLRSRKERFPSQEEFVPLVRRTSFRRGRRHSPHEGTSSSGDERTSSSLKDAVASRGGDTHLVTPLTPSATKGCPPRYAIRSFGDRTSVARVGARHPVPTGCACGTFVRSTMTVPG